MTKPQILNLLERVICAISPVIQGFFQMKNKMSKLYMQYIVFLLIFW